MRRFMFTCAGTPLALPYQEFTKGMNPLAPPVRLSLIHIYNVNPGDLYPLDYDNNGQIDQNDRVVIGSTDPKFYGGFRCV